MPTDNASANYRTQHVLDVHNVIISDGNDNESPVTENDALHAVTFFADVTANGRINAADAAGIARVAALLDGGFANTPLSDPGLLGDISGNGRLNAADASLTAQSAALLPVDQIPPIPGGVLITGLPQTRRPIRDAGQASDGDAADKPMFVGPEPYLAVDSAMSDLGSRALDDDALNELEESLEAAVEELLNSVFLAG